MAALEPENERPAPHTWKVINCATALVEHELNRLAPDYALHQWAIYERGGEPHVFMLMLNKRELPRPMAPGGPNFGGLIRR